MNAIRGTASRLQNIKHRPGALPGKHAIGRFPLLVPEQSIMLHHPVLVQHGIKFGKIHKRDAAASQNHRIVCGIVLKKEPFPAAVYGIYKVGRPGKFQHLDSREIQRHGESPGGGDFAGKKIGEIRGLPVAVDPGIVMKNGAGMEPAVLKGQSIGKRL